MSHLEVSLESSTYHALLTQNTNGIINSAFYRKEYKDRTFKQNHLKFSFMCSITEANYFIFSYIYNCNPPNLAYDLQQGPCAPSPLLTKRKKITNSKIIKSIL